MVLQNSEDQAFSINSDGWSLGAGNTVRTLTLTGADFPISLSSVGSGNLLQYNGTNWINTAGSTFGTGSVTNIATGTGLTGGPITSTGTVSISTNGVSNGLFRQSAANTIVGNPTGATANVTDIVLGSTLAFNTGQLQTTAITGDVTSSANSFATTLATVNSNIGTFTSVVVNAKGLVTAAANITASGDVTGTASGTNIALTLGTSGVTAGTYGSATQPAIITVNAKGIVTSASTGTTTLGTGSVTNIATGTGLTGGPITNTGTISMGTSGVTAGTYGVGTSFPQITVDALGRVISATTVALGSISSQGSNNVTITGGTITGLPTPVNASDAATKLYVDNAVTNLSMKQSCRLATIGSNLAGTYSNGTSGVNATITLTATGAFTLDGVAANLNDRILIKDQTTSYQNGIYSVTTVGTTGTSAVLTRTADFDNNIDGTSDTGQIAEGDYVVIEEGTINKGTLWIETGQGPFTVGTTAILFTELGVANQTITLTGDISGSGAGTVATTLATVNSNIGTFSALTVNGKGLVTAAANLVASGDATGTASGTGLALTLATVNTNVGTFNGLTINGKGLVTAAANLVASGDVTGTASGTGVTLTLGSVNSNVGTFTAVTVGTKGLVTSAANLVVSGDVTGTASGATLALTLGTSGVTAGTYGNGSAIPTIIVNAKGIVTSVSTTAITYGTGSVTNIATGTGLTGGPITNTGTISMGTSGVTAGSYSFSNTTVDALGRVTSVSAGTPVTSIIAGTGLTGGTITSTGTIALGTTGVTAGTYGNSTQTAIVTVNALGQITSASTGTTTLGTGSVTSIATGTGLTGGPITNAGTVSVGTNSITGALFRQSAASSIVGNPLGSSGNVSDITLGTGLVFTGTALAIGTSGVTAGTYSTVVVNALGQVTSGSAANETWVQISGTTQTAVANIGYIPQNSSLTTITLPTTANVGDELPIVGKGSGGWKIAQNSGQTIHFSTKNTTTGTVGYLSSNNQYNCVTLICVTANTDWVVQSSVGNLTIN